MGGGSGACKFLGIILIFILLVQGSFAAEESNGANENSNYTINDTVNGTIIGTVNGTINGTIIDTVNNTTVNGTVVGIVNGTINGTISSTRSKPAPFEWVLILPVLAGYLLFLCWMCRFFDKMNFCFVVFILIILIALLLRLLPLNFGPTAIWILFVIVLLLLIAMVLNILFAAVCSEVFPRGENNQKNESNSGNKSSKTNKSNPIMNLHDIVRNFIVISVTLMWPLLFIYFYMNNIESVTFFGIEEVEFPVIIAASSIGVLSYLLLSIEEIFGQLIPEYKKMSIAWSYLRRILIAPFMALIIVYILPFNKPDNTTLTDEISVFFFSFIAGFFTKPAEEWIYVGVQKFLPDASKEEFKSRAEKYDVEKSDFVTKLGLPEDLACMLYYAKIRTIEDLAGCNAKTILNKVNIDTRNLGEGMWCPVKGQNDRLGSYSEEQIQGYIDKANEHIGKGEYKLIKILKDKQELASRIYKFANIKTIEDLSTRNKTYIYNRLKTCNEEEEEDEIEEGIKRAMVYMDLAESELVTKLKMDKDLAFKLSIFASIKSIEDLKKMNVEDFYAKLDNVWKKDVSTDTIKKFVELAQKNFPDSSSSPV